MFEEKKIKENCKFYDDGKCYGTNVFVVDGCNCLLSDGFDKCCKYDNTEYRLQIAEQQLKLKDKVIELMAKKLLKFGMGKYYSDKTILMFYKQQALSELEE